MEVFVDRSGYAWELIEGNDFGVGAYVKGINGPNPGHIISGVERIIHWDPNGPVQIGVANERPSLAFYQKHSEETQAQIDQMNAHETTLQAQRSALEASLSTAVDVADLIANSEQIDELNAVKREQTNLQDRRATMTSLKVDLNERIAAIGRLGRDMIPINEVTEEIRVNGN